MNGGDRSEAVRAAEHAARSSYGRLLAFLVARFRDVAAAEDALAEAFAAALRTWPTAGVPAKPEAWLMTAAKRNLLMGARHERVRDAFAELERQTEAISEPPSEFPDERLRLLFACAHPSIDPAARAPLLLQTILGLEAREIAPAMLVSPTALAQRLVREKARLREERTAFEVPDRDEIEPRLFAVLEAIYAAYGLSLDGIGLAADKATDVRSEALYLARLVAALVPQHAEPMGLLALILFCESRAEARLSPSGTFVPLHAQDTARWDRAVIAEAESLLFRAAALRAPGPFQLEAAIQSAHTQRAFTGSVPWSAIAELYGALVALTPTVGCRIGQAVAVCESGRPNEGLDLLASLEKTDGKRVSAHQPFWVARAELSFRNGDIVTAIAAMERAVGLTVSPPIRAYLLERSRRFHELRQEAR